MKDKKESLIDKAKHLLTIDRGLGTGTPKVCLPILAYGILPLVIPSTNLLKELNEKIPMESGCKIKIIDFPFSANKYSKEGGGMKVLSTVGYIGIGELDVLMCILRMMIKYKDTIDGGPLFVTAGMLLNELEIKSNGDAYIELYKRIDSLTNIIIKEDSYFEVATKSHTDKLEVSENFKKGWCGLIKVLGKNKKNSRLIINKLGETIKIYEDTMIGIELCEMLREQLNNKAYRLIDQIIYSKRLKGNVAKLLYLHLLFHNMGDFQIGLDKLAKTLNITAVAKCHKKETINQAIKEIETATKKSIRTYWFKNHKQDEILAIKFSKQTPFN